jgi:hypothetical protein
MKELEMKLIRNFYIVILSSLISLTVFGDVKVISSKIFGKLTVKNDNTITVFEPKINLDESRTNFFYKYLYPDIETAEKACESLGATYVSFESGRIVWAQDAVRIDSFDVISVYENQQQVMWKLSCKLNNVTPQPKCSN